MVHHQEKMFCTKYNRLQGVQGVPCHAVHVLVDAKHVDEDAGRRQRHGVVITKPAEFVEMSADTR